MHLRIGYGAGNVWSFDWFLEAKMVEKMGIVSWFVGFRTWRVQWNGFFEA
jgi:hypothetical protein